LGLHPLIYFYAANGTFRVSAFYAFVLFVMELDLKNKKNLFIKHREDFEDIYYNNSSVVQVIARKYRSSKKGMPKIKDYFMQILYKLDEKIPKNQVMDEIRKLKDFEYLPTIIQEVSDDSGTDFKTLTKSTIFIKEALSSAPRCGICGGYLHKNAISIDHIERKQDGGIASVDNGQLTHPYCNTGYKN